jgi:hypothetical protein
MIIQVVDLPVLKNNITCNWTPPWELLKAEDLLWHTWCQRHEHDLQEEQFHIGSSYSLKHWAVNSEDQHGRSVEGASLSHPISPPQKDKDNGETTSTIKCSPSTTMEP